MTSSVYHRLWSALLIVSLLGLASCTAMSTSGSLRSQVVGSWEAVSLTNFEGTQRREPMGPGLKGRLSVDPNGFFSIVLTRAGLPKVASNNRLIQTPEESSAIATGLLLYYGRYSLDEASKVLTIQIEGSSFPNWNGITQTRTLILEGDQLTMRNQTTAVGGGSSDLVWRRLR
ncbi:MAG: lipocalin-like domain-containing protein [Burkholderiaceae bacterium]